MAQTQFQNREDCVGRGKLMFFLILQPLYRPGPSLAVLGKRTCAIRFERNWNSFMVVLCRTNTWTGLESKKSFKSTQEQQTQEERRFSSERSVGCRAADSFAHQCSRGRHCCDGRERVMVRVIMSEA